MPSPSLRSRLAGRDPRLNAVASLKRRQGRRNGGDHLGDPRLNAVASLKPLRNLGEPNPGYA